MTDAYERAIALTKQTEIVCKENMELTYLILGQLLP